MHDILQQLQHLTTERVDAQFAEIDVLPTADFLRLMNQQDTLVAKAVETQLTQIAQAVELVVHAITAGGRLVYLGAGTSGRLGVVDASEMPPTFGTPPELIQGFIAGGVQAMFASVENAEDDATAGAALVKELPEVPHVVCGISASGRAPFVLEALRTAKQRGFATVLVCTNHIRHVEHLQEFVDVLICAEVGPEVVAGSTRLKSGTAQKMILNMITTATMVRLGKTYGNIMVDVQQTNAKLRARAVRFVTNIVGCSVEKANELLLEAEGHVKTAIVMGLCNIPPNQAKARLQAANGITRKALK